MDIQNLLKKKEWTGEEVGKAIILNLINVYKQTLQGAQQPPAELFSQTQISTMIQSITDRTQGQMYNRYVGLNNWISQNHAMATARYEQVRGEINRLLLIISTAAAAEEEYKYIERLPAIMTQKQYDEIRAKRIEEQMTDENGEDLAYNVFNLIELAVKHFVMLLQTEPRKANPLKAVKKKYQTEPVKSKRILSRCNEVTGEEPPEDLTKWDIIEAGDLSEYYPALAGKDCDTYAEQTEDFRQEFQELVAAVTAEIDKTFLKGKSGIAGLHAEKWETTLFALRELYNKDFFDFKAFIEADTNIFDGNRRAIMNGIAILRPSDLLNKSPRIDESGYCAEPENVKGLITVTGLEQFTPLNEEDYESNIEQLQISRKLIEEGYYFLLGYEKAIDLIAERIGLPDFRLFKLDSAPVLEKIEALNNLFFTLYSQIKRTDYIDKAAKEQKLQVLHNYFQPLKGKEFVIPKTAITKAKKLLKNMEAFRVQDNVFLGILAMQKGRF